MDFTPTLGAWNTFLSGRDRAEQDQTLHPWGCLLPVLSPEELNGI